ncbi:MAG: SDR family oxidoreductase [Pseudomonadales bacterium]|nr:SDR family oxidoreductase [Pseudomonadales bacterium]
MSQPLAGKNAFVTGGGSGIGLACAKAFARDGANVLIMGRNEEKLQSAVVELEGESDTSINYFVGSVGVEEDVKNAVARAAIGDRLDIAVANAGTGGLAPIMITESENWDEIMQTNLTGGFYTIKHAARAMAGSGGGAI